MKRNFGKIVLMGFMAVAMCFAACSSDDDNVETQLMLNIKMF